MPQPGSENNPARIAVIGAGPAGFYAAERFFKAKDVHVKVDVFDRLPSPYGLVRAGVAPDHEKIRNVTRVFDRTASNPDFRFFGNVEYGKDLHLEDLGHYYHQVYFSTGAQVDRQLGIPGEELPGSHSATEFVAWYNGHPDFADLSFDLSTESVAVIGVGNVAIDVARILAKTTGELKTTDIADYALDALDGSNVKNIYMLGRRGPAQAAFTTPEIKELGELADARTVVAREDLELDDISARRLEEEPDRAVSKKLEIMEAYGPATRPDASRTIQIRFLASPVEILPGMDGRVGAIRVVKNRLERREDGRITSMPTDETYELPVGLVFRSVGYRGVPLPGLPFNDAWGLVDNDRGRILDEAGKPVTGCYVGGWIKRGPTGVIGTNKADAVETVESMLEDLAAGRHLSPNDASAEKIEAFIESRKPDCVSYGDWQRLDELEREAGQACGRPRIKFTSVVAMMEALGKVES